MAGKKKKKKNTRSLEWIRNGSGPELPPPRPKMMIYMKFNITKRFFMVELMEEEILAKKEFKEIVILRDQIRW